MTVHFALDRFWNKFLAFVVAAAMVACHGLLGASHVAGDPLVAIGSNVGTQAANSFTDNHRTMVHGEAISSHHGGAASEYSAVLLTVLLGSIFLLLRHLRTPRHSLKDARLRRKMCLRAITPNLPSGPILSALQVFRL